MKIKLIIPAIAAVLAISCGGKAQAAKEKMLVAGSQWGSIAIIDKETKAIEWTYALPEGSECNSIALAPDGNIFFAYKQGVRLIDRKGNTLWDYDDIEGNAEVHTAVPIAGGGFMLAVCDNPMRIVELDSKGVPVKEIRYDLGIENPHGQFRQVTKSKSGTYLIPVVSQGVIKEIDDKGELLRTIRTGGVPFSVRELAGGNLLVGAGDAHFYAEIDPATGSILKKTERNGINGVELQFVAQVDRLPNGNDMVSNWHGHARTPGSQPQLIEIDPAGNVVWSFDDKENVSYISAFYPFTE